jgi:hypothetical protein
MKKHAFIILFHVFLFMGVVGTSAHASLTTIGTASYGSNSYKLIYDDDLAITWLDYTHEDLYWANQKAWADGLNSSGVLTYSLNANVVGWTINDWRLPNTGQNPAYGFNQTTSEMGHLFYTELGNIGYLNPNGTTNPFPPAPDYYLQNKGDFDNLIATVDQNVVNYWTNGSYSSTLAWSFTFSNGNQLTNSKTSHYLYGLAVRPGLVTFEQGGGTTVPVPATLLLLGSGLLGLAGFKKKLIK